MSKQTVQQAASLRETFAQPLAEYARMVAAVRQVMTNRGAALSDWQGLREDVENQRVKIMRLRSSAAKMEKVRGAPCPRGPALAGGHAPSCDLRSPAAASDGGYCLDACAQVDEAERALEDMNRRSEAAKEKYELFKTKMVDEMARFQVRWGQGCQRHRVPSIAPYSGTSDALLWFAARSCSGSMGCVALAGDREAEVDPPPRACSGRGRLRLALCCGTSWWRRRS